MKPRTTNPSNALDAIGGLSDVLFEGSGGPMPAMDGTPLANRIEAWQERQANRDWEELKVAGEEIFGLDG